MNPINCITNPHARVSALTNCSEPILTDQSYKKSTDINVIMSQYAKTGMLPQYPSKNPVYIDETLIPDVLTSFNVVNRAQELFQELPAIVRKAMDNNPALMENFIADPENTHFLLKHGVLTKKQEAVKESIFAPQDLEFLKGLNKEQAQG